MEEGIAWQGVVDLTDQLHLLVKLPERDFCVEAQSVEADIENAEQAV